MSYGDDLRRSCEYTNEERLAILEKLSDPIFERDYFIVDDDDVVEVYINFDSSLPEIDWHYYKADWILDAYESAGGNAEIFFSIITNNYDFEYQYIGDDEDVEMARREMSIKGDAEGCTKESMEKIVEKVRNSK